MIKEAKNIDFYTTGRQPPEEDFARISEWIKRDKEKNSLNQKRRRKKSTSPDKSTAASGDGC